MRAADKKYVTIARGKGANLAWTIIEEARRADPSGTVIPLSRAFAIIEQESGFRNVWGHDPPPNGGTTRLGGKKVTKADYLAYRKRRGKEGKGGMQGVGPAQLTWYSFQDRADDLGGCWRPRYNIRAAFEHLAALIRLMGVHDGIARYNGTGQAAQRYAKQVREREILWHARLVRG